MCSLMLCLSCSPQPSSPKTVAPLVKAPDKAPVAAQAPLPDLLGYPLKNLAPAARRPFSEIVQEELCGCDNPRTLAGCLSKKEPCAQAMVLSGLLKGLLESGVDRAQTQLIFSRLITDGMCADQITDLDVSGLPFKSNTPSGQPAVQIIEFADFMCSHCAQAASQFRPIMASSLPVHFIYVPVQLGANEMSSKSAYAALAAWRQGHAQFWTFHDLLFEHQHELNDAKLTTFAKEVGLDLDRWNADRKGPAVKAIFKKAQTLSVRAGVQGTPYVLIDGRPLNNTVTATDLAARIQLEMLRYRKECEE
jgi:hypothetical protein